MIRKIDHAVITTADISACVAFYAALGFEVRESGGRWELFAGDFKLNVHLRGHELEPKAQNVQTGSADLCFEVEDSLPALIDELGRKGISVELGRKGISVELGIVSRNGVRGEMQSLYLRDPDGNLIELSSYD